jgi:adenosylmethionine-8-amino-7-oxononanoate aminotransferase
MICVEVVKDWAAKEPFGDCDRFPLEFGKLCAQAGAWLRIANSEIIVSPTLIFTKANADEVVAIMDDVLQRATRLA